MKYYAVLKSSLDCEKSLLFFGFGVLFFLIYIKQINKMKDFMLLKVDYFLIKKNKQKKTKKIEQEFNINPWWRKSKSTEVLPN